ncbi:MAG TPA: hypothetical protein VK601_31220 [Kofleriaceae bacterium]|nr:hypothetical protein [Kofleriaceae bacterium]
MKYAYQRDGAPLIRWGQVAPMQSRAADSVALGSLGGGSSLDHSTLEQGTIILPRPGAPEVIDGSGLSGLGGCSCSGSCGCGSAAPSLSGIVDAIPGGVITLGIAAAVAAWMLLKKKH